MLDRFAGVVAALAIACCVGVSACADGDAPPGGETPEPPGPGDDSPSPGDEPPEPGDEPPGEDPPGNDGPTYTEDDAIEDNWALRETRAIEAWALVRERGREPGEGVLIAHADTGISRHPELLGASDADGPIAWDLGFDFVDDDDDPSHDFRALNRIPGHGHGTETSSVIVSPLGCPPGEERPCVTGAAPAASLVPMRVSDSVVLLSGNLLADGIDYAIEIDAHVVSIAMGGVGEMARLEDAIARALDAGIIVIAASGNGTGTIVAKPSSLDGVVAVAGVARTLTPWQLSARGPRIDIAAPSNEIWHARTEFREGAEEYSVGLAQGTSDATSLTASAAALWLSYHGRDELIARYGRSELPRVFRGMLKTWGFRRLPDWPNNGNWGPGILDMVALLEAELP